MHTDGRIPVIVGVTAHRALRPQDEAALRASVRSELVQLQGRCPHAPLVMLTSLAEGGDLLCAEEALELGITLRVALPAEATEYERDMSEDGLLRFRRCCAAAEQVYVVPYTEEIPPEGPGRNYRFRQAGIHVASHCHVLLALWDGGPGTPAACGTAEAVEFALRANYVPADFDSPVTGHTMVIHIFTPRGTQTGTPAGTVRRMGDEAILDGALERTEEFDRLVLESKPSSRSVLPLHPETDPALEQMAQTRSAAAALATSHARRYRRVLALLAIAGALFTASFLLYDEAQAIFLILVCGILLLAAGCALTYASRSACHRRYLEYRALAECLRVQIFLRYAGTGVLAEDLLTWTQQEETHWISLALSALTAAPIPTDRHEIRTWWVEKQRRYHETALIRSSREQHTSDRTVHAALIVSIFLYLAAVVFEVFFGGVLCPAVAPAVDAESWRTALKIALGLLSAVTLLIAGYYGHLSLPRVGSDHRKMARFYAAMEKRLDREGQTEKLLIRLAREELIENGNWCSYQRDNVPDISI